MRRGTRRSGLRGTSSARALTAIDLFAGCGGLTQGLKKAGFRVLGAVELDALAAKTYRTNHPEVRLWEMDIRRLHASTVKRALKLDRRRLDLLAGCPPCQGFSTIRTLNGAKRIRDPRNDLVFEFLRFVRVLRPRAVLMENVPGLAENRRALTLSAKLRRLGYRCEVRVLDASDYGVPQRRRRMILLAGHRIDLSFARKARCRRTVRSAIGSLPRPSKSRDPLHNLRETRRADVKERIRLVPKNGGSRRDLDDRFQLPCHTVRQGFWDIYGRMAWDDVSPTITAGCINPSKGRFLHPTQNRAITLREAALLQTLPKRYFISLERGKYAAAELIGNAFPPAFVERQARAISRGLAASRTGGPNKRLRS